MKKTYVAIVLDLVVFDKEDVIRTSGNNPFTNGFTETEVDFDSYFGGN